MLCHDGARQRSPRVKDQLPDAEMSIGGYLRTVRNEDKGSRGHQDFDVANANSEYRS